MEQITQLDKIEANKKGKLVYSKLTDKVKNHLAELGIVSTSQIKIERNKQPEPLIILVKNTKIILSRKIASKIYLMTN